MNITQAITQLQGDCAGLPSGDDKANMLSAINTLNDTTSTQEENETALVLIDSVYWNKQGNFSDACETGQAIYCLSYNVDPSRPYPIQRPS